MKALAISGSLRAQSTNTTLLNAVKLIASPHVDVVLYNELETIPPFNPDLDLEPGPNSVSRLRAALRDSSAVLFSTPEYAHGVPGALKNALDWIVGSGELSGKPVALFNASVRGAYAQASLREILKTMDAQVLADAEITIPLLGKSFDASQIFADPEFVTLILSSIQRIVSSVSKS
ncbi:NADPH-dependent FMN reductase [Granulicella sp. L56]|uniref:NADPH-dependent FMN reductase n=1 Tax=Granulicella sp. L56 TaxID=1747222 RepID=UPI00131A7894|nr:NADPH-dependent FMN reductase [Granulicella sp. L56]